MFTHGDLHITHVFVDGDQITDVIDWPEACRDDRSARRFAFAAKESFDGGVDEFDESRPS